MGNHNSLGLQQVLTLDLTYNIAVLTTTIIKIKPLYLSMDQIKWIIFW